MKNICCSYRWTSPIHTDQEKRAGRIRRGRPENLPPERDGDGNP